MTCHISRYGDLKLMIADEQRPLIPEWAREILSSPGRTQPNSKRLNSRNLKLDFLLPTVTVNYNKCLPR